MKTPFALIFTCCHPHSPPNARWSDAAANRRSANSRDARAFMSGKPHGPRLVRAKNKIREDIPTAYRHAELHDRLRSVLAVSTRLNRAYRNDGDERIARRCDEEAIGSHGPRRTDARLGRGKRTSRHVPPGGARTTGAHGAGRIRSCALPTDDRSGTDIIAKVTRWSRVSEPDCPGRQSGGDAATTDAATPTAPGFRSLSCRTTAEVLPPIVALIEMRLPDRGPRRDADRDNSTRSNHLYHAARTDLLDRLGRGRCTRSYDRAIELSTNAAGSAIYGDARPLRTGSQTSTNATLKPDVRRAERSSAACHHPADPSSLSSKDRRA